MAIGAKEALNASHLDAVADKGYYDLLQLKECVDNGITPSVVNHDQARGGFTQTRGIPKPEFYVDRFVYNRSDDTYTCPAGQKLV